jgi:hypothetical protein
LMVETLATRTEATEDSRLRAMSQMGHGRRCQ